MNSEPQGQHNENPPVLALRMNEAARALGISKRSLEDMTSRGEVPYPRLGRRLLVYPVHLLREWLTDRAKIPDTDEIGENDT